MSSLDPKAATSFESFLENRRISDSLKQQMRSHVTGLLRVEVTTQNEEHKVGASRIGGDPDLPLKFEWPKGHLPHVCMVFLAQFDLADFPQQAELPRDGHLLFFLDIDEPAYNIKSRVCYFPKGTTLERRRFPDGNEPAIEIEGGEHAFPACQLKFVPDWELDLHAIEATTNLSDDEQDLVDDLAKGCTQVLGMCESWSEDPRIEAYLHANGMGELHFHTHQTRHDLAQDHRLSEELIEKLDDWHARKEQHLKNAMQWTLLFKLASEHDAGMCWWDAGFLQFLIHKDDLKESNFSRVYCDLATS